MVFQMLWKFGLDLGLLNNKAAIKEKILEIENNFDLVRKLYLFYRDFLFSL